MSAFVGASVTDVLSSTETTLGKAFGLGDRYEDGAGKRYVYVRSTDTIAQYDVCTFDTSFLASRITKALADGGPAVGVAAGTLSSGWYGWVQTFGATSINVLSTCSSSIALYTSATAGKLDDTATSQDKIAGVVILANITAAGTASGMIATTPFVAL